MLYSYLFLIHYHRLQVFVIFKKITEASLKMKVHNDKEKTIM